MLNAFSYCKRQTAYEVIRKIVSMLMLFAALGWNHADAKQNQTITFTALYTSYPLTVGTVTLSATSTSGLAVTFTVAPLSVCTVSSSTVSLLSTGTCTITASVL